MALSGLDERYLDWLIDQVQVSKAKHPSKTYRSLLTQLYTKEFVWFVANDDNRAQDGIDLRVEWFNEIGEHHDAEWAAMGCSMLELLIGLARRLHDMQGGGPSRWFWVLVDNIGLASCTDNSRFRPEAVDDVLERVIWRTYLDTGQGGLFPLTDTEEDQREVELWYQLNAYILERL